MEQKLFHHFALKLWKEEGRCTLSLDSRDKMKLATTCSLEMVSMQPLGSADVILRHLRRCVWQSLVDEQKKITNKLWNASAGRELIWLYVRTTFLQNVNVCIFKTVVRRANQNTDNDDDNHDNAGCCYHFGMFQKSQINDKKMRTSVPPVSCAWCPLVWPVEPAPPRQGARPPRRRRSSPVSYEPPSLVFAVEPKGEFTSCLYNEVTVTTNSVTTRWRLKRVKNILLPCSLVTKFGPIYKIGRMFRLSNFVMSEQHHKNTFNLFVIGQNIRLNFVTCEPGFRFICSSRRRHKNNNYGDDFATVWRNQFIISLTVAVVEIIALTFAANYRFNCYCRRTA